jgi:hypothetical protein
VRALSLELSDAELAELESFRLSPFDLRSLAKRFIPPRFRRLAVAALRPAQALRRR